MRVKYSTKLGNWEIGVAQSWELGEQMECMHAGILDQECRYLKPLFTEL